MAIIYDFSQYHTPRLLRTASRQAGEVTRYFQDLGENMNKIGAIVSDIQETHRKFGNQMGRQLSKLEKTKTFARKCSDACKLESVEQMIEKRDQLKRGQLTRGKFK